MAYLTPLAIETGDVTIDAEGVYDDDGYLVSLYLDGRYITPDAVEGALAALGYHDTTWRRALCDETLRRERFRRDVAEAEYREAAE